MLVKQASADQKLNGPQSEQRRQALKRRLRTNRMLMAMGKIQKAFSRQNS